MTNTFKQFVQKRRDRNQSVAVYVEGDYTHDPPLGRAAALQVAHILEDGEIVFLEGIEADDDVNDPSVIVIRIPQDPSEREYNPTQRRLLSRTPSETDFVVLTHHESVPWFCRDLADVRIVATGIDDPIECYRVKFNPYEGEAYYHELAFQGEDP